MPDTDRNIRKNRRIGVQAGGSYWKFGWTSRCPWVDFRTSRIGRTPRNRIGERVIGTRWSGNSGGNSRRTSEVVRSGFQNESAMLLPIESLLRKAMIIPDLWAQLIRLHPQLEMVDPVGMSFRRGIFGPLNQGRCPAFIGHREQRHLTQIEEIRDSSDLQSTRP